MDRAAMLPPRLPAATSRPPRSGTQQSAPRSDSRDGINLPSNPSPPRPLLNTDQAVSQWHTTPGFRAFWGWILRRCDRIKGRDIIDPQTPSSSTAIASLMDMLDRMTAWVDEAPPQEESNQRFGNLAFRDYIKLVETRLPDLKGSFPRSTSDGESSAGMPEVLQKQILPLFINSNAFGHITRLDYGTGHELAYILALWCCVISGWVGGPGKEDEDDELVLRVFPRYLELVTLLQKTYRLEPAGSHGVWGLDDYCFFPYLFGSAQLLESNVSPSQALQNALNPKHPIRDMYTHSLHRITLFKTGASFREHSPLLNDLASFPSWQKPHAGLRKMFMGEVVGKRVVVQGLWIGGWLWGGDLPEEGDDGRRERNQREKGGSGEGTEAPWRTDGRSRVLSETRNTWTATVPPRQ